MESESFYNLLQNPKVTGPSAEEELPQGAVPTWGWGAGQGGDGEGLHSRTQTGSSGRCLAFQVAI